MRSEPYFTHTNEEKKANQWIETLHRGARVRRIPFHMEKSALLVVDALNAFFHPRGSASLESAPVTLKNILTLVDLFESSGRPILFATHCHQAFSGLFKAFYRGHIQCGSFDARLVEDLASRPHRAFPKETYDAFSNPALEPHLASLGVTQLVLAGGLTHLCIASTARSAFTRELLPFVPVDATCSTTESLHLAALLSLTDACAIPSLTRELTP